MVLGEPSVDGVKKIFTAKPHQVWDNYFSGDQIMDWMGEQGYGVTMTCHHDHLPKDIDGKFLHKLKTPVDKCSKAARFNPPIVAVKTVAANGDKKKYTRVHVSFQSTSSCNISTVNALNDVKLYIKEKTHGKGDNK